MSISMSEDTAVRTEEVVIELERRKTAAVAEGYVLTCQALPTSQTVRLTYDY